MKTCEETRPWLEAYLDGELDPIHNAAIERHLRDCAACAQIQTAQQELSRALAAPGLRFAAPADLRAYIMSALRAEAGGATPPEAESKSGKVIAFPSIFGQGRRALLAIAAAALVALGVGFTLAQFLSGGGGATGRELLAQEVVASHIRSLMAAHLADVISTDRHTVKPWFDGKLDFAPVVADFTIEGFPLQGGRLDYLDGRPVAALVYGRDKHVINLFVWPAAGEISHAAPAFLERQGYQTWHWQAEGMNFSAVSDLNAAELRAFAELARRAATPN